jgi:drug/metabolite transporter (DMT)-like permease
MVAIIVLANTFADLLNTFGMQRHGRVQNFAPSGIGRLIGSIVRNGYVLGGIAAMAVSFFALLSLLSVANVSFAIPATAASYMLETILAKLILREDVRWRRWLGATLVSLGVMLLALP